MPGPAELRTHRRLLSNRGPPVRRALAGPDLDSSLPSSGRALSGVKLRLADDGRLEFFGPSLLSRWDEATPLSSDGYFRTGDRASITEKGELVVLGRADDVIVTGGEKVDPLSVEAVLLTFPGVRAACVFAEPEPRWGSVVAAAIVSSEKLDETALVRHCAARLASHERRASSPPSRPSSRRRAASWIEMTHERVPPLAFTHS